LEEGKSPQAAGEPVTGRVRIAGVEAGVAAGLVPPAEAAARAGPEPLELVSGSVRANEASMSFPVASVALPGYDLPDWTDPPTLQVPRVILDLEQEAAERGGPPTPPRGGPVWRERQEDWDDTDAILGHLASAGPSVTDYEESSSDDPFAYDFLNLDDESSWITREDASDKAKAGGRAQTASAPTPEPPKPVPQALAKPATSSAESSTVHHGVPENELPSDVLPRRRHNARSGLTALKKRPSPSVRAEPAPQSSPETASSRNRLPARAEPAPQPKGASASSRNPVVATLTGVVLAAVLLLSFKAGPPAVLALVAAAVTLAAAELFNSLRLGGYRPATLLGLVGVPAVIVGAYFRGPTAVLVGFVIFVVASMIWYLAGFTRRSPLVNLSVTVLAFAWTGVLAAFAGLLVDPRIFPDRHGIAFMLGAVIAAVGYDIGGYVIGSRFGRHPLAPSVSPNKTWEGLIGGCAIAIAASAAITSRIHPWHVSTAVWLGLIVAVVAPCGDLVESMIKRDLKVKDMGTLLPGHGGVFDRIDALLFVLPAAYIFVRLAHIG